MLLDHFECLFVLVAIAVYRTGPDHHLGLVVSLSLYEVLVLHVVEVLVHHLLVLGVHVLRRGSMEFLLQGLLWRGVSLTIYVLWLNLKIFLFLLVPVTPWGCSEDTLVFSVHAMIEMALERVDLPCVREIDVMLGHLD